MPQFLTKLLVSNRPQAGLKNSKCLALLCLTAALASLLPGAAMANNQGYYQIEYILLEHLDQDKNELRYEPHSEPKTHQNPRFYLDQPLKAGQRPLSAGQVYALPKGERILQKSYERLKRARYTRVLQYRQWHQRFSARQNNISIVVDDILKDKRRLQGSVTLRKSRYLHIEPDVKLSTPVALPKLKWLDFLPHKRPKLSLESALKPVLGVRFKEDFVRPLKQRYRSRNAGHAWVDTKVVHFKASRRLKNEEQHYLDHPALSLIATYKYIKPEAE